MSKARSPRWFCSTTIGTYCLSVTSCLLFRPAYASDGSECWALSPGRRADPLQLRQEHALLSQTLQGIAVPEPREIVEDIKAHGVTEDELVRAKKPDVEFVPPNNPHKVRNAFTIRVPDCQAAYEVLKSRGADFLTPPVDHGYETRAFFRDPDGHLFEISQVGG